MPGWRFRRLNHNVRRRKKAGERAMEEKAKPTLADRWMSRLKDHKLVAAAIVLGVAVGGIATFAESAKKLLETIGVIDRKPPTPIVIKLPDPAPVEPVKPKTPTEPPTSCISAADIAGYTAELGTVERLLAEGKALVYHQAAPPGLYQRIMAWEDTSHDELSRIDRNHPTFTAFSFEFEYWKSQKRVSGNDSVNAAQMERNLAVLRKAREFLNRAVAEGKARACPS